MSATKNRAPSIKFTSSLRPDLFKWMCQKADEFGMTRSAFMAMALSQYKVALETQPKLNTLLDNVNRLVADYEAGKISRDEAIEKVSEIDARMSELPKPVSPGALT